MKNGCSQANCISLIISPHIDDEVLGCYSFLWPSSFVLYLGVEERTCVSTTERKNELKSLAAKMGFSWEVLDYPVNSYETSQLISTIEGFINRLEPQIVLMPYLSYNQDHRATYEAALTATRPHDNNWQPKTILCYEQPQVILHPYRAMTPNFFREIDIADKIASYNLYRSQVRGHRSPEILQSLGKIRGSQVGVPYAEGFLLIRHLWGSEIR